MVFMSLWQVWGWGGEGVGFFDEDFVWRFGGWCVILGGCRKWSVQAKRRKQKK